MSPPGQRAVALSSHGLACDCRYLNEYNYLLAAPHSDGRGWNSSSEAARRWVYTGAPSTGRGVKPRRITRYHVTSPERRVMVVLLLANDCVKKL